MPLCVFVCLREQLGVGDVCVIFCGRVYIHLLSHRAGRAWSVGRPSRSLSQPSKSGSKASNSAIRDRVLKQRLEFGCGERVPLRRDHFQYPTKQ
jgi:hypothetical protein